MPNQDIILSQTLYQSIIDSIANIIWSSFNGAEIFIFLVAIYIVAIILLWWLYHTTQNLFNQNKKKFFFSCDEIIYQFSQNQYQQKHDPNINNSLMKDIFMSQTKDYFTEKSLFENKVKEIQNKLSKNIISKDNLSKFYRYYKNTKLYKLISTTIWRILTISTLWIYRLFM